MAQDAKNKEIVKTPTDQQEFAIMDDADEQQIINADEALKLALVYKVTVGGKEVVELSYVGLKHLTLLMSQTGQPLQIIDAKMELLGDKVEEKVWYATVKVRNQKTGHESIGMSEAPYLFNGKYDSFGRTKALSKAERNAWRKQIPEFELKKLLNDALGKGQVKELQLHCTCEPGKRDINPITKKCGRCGKPAP